MHTYWNGEPCVARKVTVIVADSGFHPLYWAKELVGQRVPAVEVHYAAAAPFYLYDEGDHGWDKVTYGKGSPRYSHRSLDIEEGSVNER